MEEKPRNAGSSPPSVGSYRLLKPLGSGGMSSVFLAKHKESGLEVAVKILPRSLARNPTLLQRFLREAKSAEALEHPSIVAIYDRGVDDGRHYLVLELVSGGDLHDYIRTHGPMSPIEATRVIRQAVDGLKYAADLGVIHRDVKPANLLLTSDGRVKVTDLGLALQLEDEDQRVTRDGTTVGTVDYMAPEQARDSRATSVRSDIYSLGCTYYYLLTGSAPFPGGDLTDKLRRHATEPAPDVRKARPEVSPRLAGLIRRMMAKNPENRFVDYDELIAALDALPDLSADDSDGFPALVPLDEEASNPRVDFVLGPAPASETGRIPQGPTIETRAPSPGSKASEAVREFPARPLRAVESPLLRQMLADEEAEPGLPPPIFDASGSYRDQTDSLGPYIVRGALVGIAIVVAVLGLRAVFAPATAPDRNRPARQASANPPESNAVMESAGIEARR